MFLGCALFVFASCLAVAAETSISIATVIPPGTPVPAGLNRMSELLNKTGNFKTAVFPGSQLGSLVDVMDRCLDGDPVIMTCGPDDLAELTEPDLYIAQAPFLLNSWDDVDKLMGSQWWKDMLGKVEKKGMKILAYNWTFGERHILTKKPITKLADLQGLKIRTPNNLSFARAFEALGCAPTPMALAEVFTSLQQGTIDGLENPYTDIYANRFNEVAKFAVDDVHMRQICLIICGTEFYNTLTAEQRKQMVDAAVEAGAYQRTLVQKANDEVKAKLAADGVTFTNIDVKEFEAATNKYYQAPEFSRWTPGLRETVLGILGR